MAIMFVLGAVYPVSVIAQNTTIQSMTGSINRADFSNNFDWNDAMDATLDWVFAAEPSPQVGGVLGEWAVLAMARAGRVDMHHPWVQCWLYNLAGVLAEIDRILEANPDADISNPPAVSTFPGALRRWTDFQRVVITLAALGLNPTDVNGHDLTATFSGFVPTEERHALNRTVLADIFSVIALDAVRTDGDSELFLQNILDLQRDDGTWSLNPTAPSSALDVDITAMALQALAPYFRDGDEAVVDAATRAKQWLVSQAIDTPESTAQIIIAFAALGIDHGYYVDTMLEWFDPQSGGIRRPNADSPVNPLATAQAAYALVARWRFANDKTALFDIGGDFDEFAPVNIDLSSLSREASFSHGVAEPGIFGSHEPNETLTRAEFADIITRAFNLPIRHVDVFEDVPLDAWFATAVGTAFYFEIITGVSATRFNPDGVLTRQEAAVMITRAARLTGMNTSRTEAQIRGTLELFEDGHEVASWARESFVFLFDSLALVYYELADVGVPGYRFFLRPGSVIAWATVDEMLYRIIG